MIVAVAQIIRSDKRIRIALATIGVLTVAAVAGWILWSAARGDTEDPGGLARGKVEHVRSGHKVVLDGGEDVLYAGVRAPFQDEPLFDEALKRNTELVGGKKVRLRFEETVKDKKDRLLAYVFADGVHVNEQLVREGLAYAQVTTSQRRFEKELLTAQNDARKQKRGLWRLPTPPSETTYPADPKYGSFHRPSCEEVPNIKPERLVTFPQRNKAFDSGFAPCHKCKP